MSDIESASFTGTQDSVADTVFANQIVADVVDAEANDAEGIDREVIEAESREQIEDPRVLAAIERLADLDGLPVTEQVEIFADVHARLTEALGTEAEHTFETSVSEADGNGESGQAAFGDMPS